MKKSKNFKDTVIRPMKDDTRTMRLEKLVSNRYALPVILLFVDGFFYLLLNFIVNTTRKLFLFFQAGNINGMEVCFSVKNVMQDVSLLFTSNTIRYLYIAFLIIVILIDISLVYRIRVSLADENFNVNIKGDSRFTTIEEIKEQYKEIEDKEKPFKGVGGTIISRWKEKLYIDTSNTNNLIIGMTRSGKGEFFVFPSIDVYSRAEIQSSMVLLDPKLELYKSSKKTLEERGYEVYLLNFINPLKSMGYNPLSLIIKYYKSKEFDKAEEMAKTFSFSIFNPNKATGDGKFFDATASQVLSALIISHVADCLAEDELENEKRFTAYIKKQEQYEELEEDFKEQTTEDFYKKKAQLEADNQDIFLADSIQYIPSEEKFLYTQKYEKCITMYSLINTLVELGSIPIEGTTDSALDEYFNSRPKLDRAKLKYASIKVAGDRTKGSILSNTLSQLETFTYGGIAKLTAESSLDLRDIGFGKKPVAVFLGIPDYDSSKHFLATVFIKQAYYHLAEGCQSLGKCKRPVKFICDEFGNMPEIEDMKNMITVCLGRNISFDMYIQAYSQMNKVYGDDADTIIGNCGNQIYILSADQETAENFSKLIGSETKIDVQRTGGKLKTDKNFTEMSVDKPLLNSNQLMELEEGECVIKRTMKRRDNKRNSIRPRPIFNSRKTGTAFKYRYEYLQDTFPNPDDIVFDDINTESREHINEQERVWDFDITFKHYLEADENEMVKIKTLGNMNPKVKKQLVIALEKVFGKEDMKIYNINDDISISKLVDTVTNYDSVAEYEKKAILNIITGSEMGA